MPMKRCSKCGIEKDTSMFGRRVVARDGLKSRCKACELESSRNYEATHRTERAEKSRMYRKNNPEKIRAANEGWKKDHPERHKEIHAACLARHPDRVRERRSRYYIANAESIKEKRRTYYNFNKLDIQTKQRDYNSRKPEIARAAKARYAKAHPERVRAAKAHWRIGKERTIADYAYKRLIQLRNATPAWLSEIDRATINETYVRAAKLTNETGVSHQVDHIVPLQGREVSGLHVPWNLQILTASQNIRKGNKWVTA